MGWASRLLCTVLAVLLVFAGGIVDLCACDAGAHGSFCADSGGAVAQASCHVEREPVPLPAHGCCDPPELEPLAASCCEPVPHSAGKALRSPGCDCPVIAFDHSPSESPVTAGGHVEGVGADAIALAPAFEDAGVATIAPWQMVRASEPRAPALRRHLALHVLRF